MSLVPVKGTGQFGVNKDLSSSELPINAWTDCKNIRFLDGYAWQFYGHGEIYASPPVIPYHVMPVTVAGVRYWLYTSNAKMYVVNSAAHTNITRVAGDYAATKNSWTSTVLGGIPIINNGVDAPQMWMLSLASPAIALSNWPVNATCASMRVYKNSLIALDVTAPPAIAITSITRVGTTATLTTTAAHGLSNGNTVRIVGALPAQYNGTYVIGGAAGSTFTYTMASDPGASASPVGFLYGGTPVRRPYMVKWSHPADPGTVPSTWEVTDTTKDAGEIDLSDGYGYIIDGLALRNSFMIYKTDGVFRLDYTGGIFVYNNQKVLGMSGALNKNCIVEIDGSHFCVTGFDVVIHDGNQAVSILDKQSRRYLFQNIDATNSYLTFVFKNPFLNEVFICYPSIGATSCDKAMVWNWVDKTISFRDIPNLNHAAYGALETGLSQTWDSDPAPWGSDVTLWNSAEFTPDVARVVMGSDDTKLYQLDSSATFNGVFPDAYLERKGLSFDAPDSIKIIRGIRPRITGTTGATVLISVGSSNEPYEEPTYTEAVPFTIGTTVSCDLFCTGRYMAIKFASGTAYQWRLDSYTVDVVLAGKW
jgi:hypothetical protein